MAYDWDLIKREYIQGYPDKDGKVICPTLEDLCSRHGCSYSTITTKSSKGKWKQQRQLFGKKRQEKIIAKKEEILIDESVNIDNKGLNLADKGMDIVDKLLSEKDLSPTDVQKLSNTASTFHKMGKLALGEETEHTKTTGKQEVEVSIHDRIKNYDEYFKDLDTS